MSAQLASQVDLLLDHEGPWTEEDYLALPETMLSRVELIDGSLLVSPRPSGAQQQWASRLHHLLDACVAEDLEVFQEPDLRLMSGRIVCPDVMVTREGGDLTLFDAKQVVLVVEVVSPGGIARDRILKYGLYAAAQIPLYLLVERDDEGVPWFSLHRLEGDVYKECGRAHAGQQLRIDELDVSLDPGDLLRRGAR